MFAIKKIKLSKRVQKKGKMIKFGLKIGKN